MHRYQSLVAVFITATVAGIGIIVGYEQLNIARNNSKGVAVANAYDQFEKACERQRFLERALIFIQETNKCWAICGTLVATCSPQYRNHDRIAFKVREVVQECRFLRSSAEKFDEEAIEIEFRRHMGLMLVFARLFEHTAQIMINEPREISDDGAIDSHYENMSKMSADFERLYMDFNRWYHSEAVMRANMVYFWNKEYIYARRNLPVNSGNSPDS